MNHQQNGNSGANVPPPAQPIPGVILKSPPYYPMARAQERRSIKIGQLIFWIIMEIVAPAANRLLILHGYLSAGVQIDFQRTMFLIKKLKIAKPHLLASMSFQQLQLVSNARNDSHHDNLAALMINESVHVSILRDFCTSLREQQAAVDVQRLWNHASSGDFQSAFIFNFRFTVAYDEHVAHCLCLILYAVIIIYLAVSLYEFRLTRYPLAIEPPPIDAYSNLKFFKQEQKKNVNYFGPGGGRRRDRELLKECLNARKQNRHSGHKETFSGWVNQLDDIIRLLDVMKFGFRARAVETIRDTLIVARRRRTIVCSTLFPSLFN
jgi:hypothetical protein